MKDSGIPWVGEIPADWEVGKVKGCLRRHEVKGHGDAMVLALYRDHGVVPKDSRDDNHNRTGKDTNDYKYVREGDLVINKMKAWQGSLSVSGFEGIVSPAYFIYEFVGHNLDRGFADYLLRSTYKQEFERVSGGIREGQWDLPRYDFEHMQLPLPSMEEQQRIADYLDERCAAIDEVRRTIEDEVEALRRLRKATIHRAVTKGLDEGVPMRDSGVEWIGEMPEAWVICRMKVMLASIPHALSDGPFGSDMKSDEYQESGVPITQLNNIKEGVHKDDSFKYISSEKAETLSSHYVYPGELLMAKMMPAGRTCLVSNAYPKYVLSSDSIRIVPSKEVDRRFLCYAANAYSVVEAELMSKGSTRVRISLSIVRNMRFAIPLFSEQQRIADYLDERCDAIDSIIDTRTKQLERLEDYRKALIFAYVTGKKEVPTHA